VPCLAPEKRKKGPEQNIFRFSFRVSAKMLIFAVVMPFHVPINILDFIFKGMMIGLIASAPMGPTGVLCVQRTLKKGRWYGFVTGVGAAASDIIYAGITGFGMAFVMDFINDQQNRFYLQIAGSLMLLAFGWYTYRTDPTRKMHQSSQDKGTLTYNLVTAFFVTLSNPLIVFLFMALYAQFAFVLPDHPFEMLVGFLSIVGGALLWWWGLTWLVDKIRTKFDENGIKIINQVIGVAVIIGSIIMLLGTTTNLLRW
jgi:threonine/homoserine/homoserine lactone efflux protein